MPWLPCVTRSSAVIYQQYMISTFYQYELHCCHHFDENICNNSSTNVLSGVKSMINSLSAGNTWMCIQHCGYWCPGAKAPGHQQPQCALIIYCTRPVSHKRNTFTVNIITNLNYIMNKKCSFILSETAIPSYIRHTPHIMVIWDYITMLIPRCSM